jgi:hypothetical protein
MYSNNAKLLRTRVSKYVWQWQTFVAAHVAGVNFIRKTEASIRLHKVYIKVHTVNRKSCFQFRDYVGRFIISEEGGQSYQPSQTKKEHGHWQATLTAQAHRLYWLYSCMMRQSHDKGCEPLRNVIPCYAITAIKLVLWRSRFYSLLGVESSDLCGYADQQHSYLRLWKLKFFSYLKMQFLHHTSHVAFTLQRLTVMFFTEIK